MLRNHLWMSPIILSGQQERRGGYTRQKSTSSQNTGNLAHFLEPVYGSCGPSEDESGGITGKRLWWEGRKRARSSDEGDPYRDGGRLCPVLRGVMGHDVLHHRVFRHVLHKVRL